MQQHAEQVLMQAFRYATVWVAAQALVWELC